MNRPYIICHMMMTLDGRIDWGMTKKVKGVEEYYEILKDLNAPSTVSGRFTAQLKMSKPGIFRSGSREIYGKTGFHKNIDAKGYEVIMDTRGTLLWNKAVSEKPYLIIVAENVTKEYLEYLDHRNISWIACGKEKSDLKGALEILYREFGVKRMALVGGGHINAGFLDEGVIDEVSILLAPAIDGRESMSSLFDGRPVATDFVQMELLDVKKYDNGALWLHYKV